MRRAFDILEMAQALSRELAAGQAARAVFAAADGDAPGDFDVARDVISAVGGAGVGPGCGAVCDRCRDGVLFGDRKSVV